MAAKLVRVDKNGTKYYEETVACRRCNGTGRLKQYQHIADGECFNCWGSGIEDISWKEMTPEYEAKLEQRRLAKELKKVPEQNAKFFAHEGFDDEGNCWLVVDEANRDDLKAAGCRWNPVLGWHFMSKVEGYELHKVNVSEIGFANYVGAYIGFADNASDTVKSIRNSYAKIESTSEYIGSVGDKLETSVKHVKTAGYDTMYGYMYVYTFADANGNLIVWKTGSVVEIDSSSSFVLKGTIKEHNEYKGEKQTIMTRCKIKAA